MTDRVTAPPPATIYRSYQMEDVDDEDGYVEDENVRLRLGECCTKFFVIMSVVSVFGLAVSFAMAFYHPNHG